MIVLCNNYANGRVIGCSKKGFVCYDETRFYQCVHVGGKYIISRKTQSCPDGLICRNDADLECEEDIQKDYLMVSNADTIVSANTYGGKLNEM
ncbi:hypothetical protein NQ315_003888 [Exocentrus adspersus]|uniref:Uncharacterized protein n=1 Tax=Exocentrus adspersus TaxID=1586481 RepID=A0AAV8VZ28_9CUCU|nr:hypothetical protein NQ315_003888 [Exocentrus adspersus]